MINNSSKYTSLSQSTLAADSPAICDEKQRDQRDQANTEHSKREAVNAAKASSALPPSTATPLRVLRFWQGLSFVCIIICFSLSGSLLTRQLEVNSAVAFQHSFAPKSLGQAKLLCIVRGAEDASYDGAYFLTPIRRKNYFVYRKDPHHFLFRKASGKPRESFWVMNSADYSHLSFTTPEDSSGSGSTQLPGRFLMGRNQFFPPTVTWWQHSH